MLVLEHDYYLTMANKERLQYQQGEPHVGEGDPMTNTDEPPIDGEERLQSLLRLWSVDLYTTYSLALRRLSTCPWNH